MQLGRRVAFIASGDLSHRLKPEAPAGFNPSAHFFDEEVIDGAACKCAGSDRGDRPRFTSTRGRVRVSIDARRDRSSGGTAFELRCD